jgi:antitoxin ParD1/3/4
MRRAPLAIVAKAAILREINEIGPMPTRNVSLTPEQDAFIDEVLKAGEYRNASEAMRDAIRALQQRRAEQALKLDKLRLSIRQGVAALDRGDYTEVEDGDLDAYLDDLAAPTRR